MTSVKGQLIFREASAEKRGPLSYQRSAPKDERFTFLLGLGIVQCPVGTYQDEAVYPLMIVERDGCPSLQVTGEPEKPDAHSGVAICDANGVLTSIEVKTPSEFNALVSGGAGGGLFLRRSRFPSPEGHETMIAVTLVRAFKDQIPERTMFAFEGGPWGLTLANPEPRPEAFPMGDVPGNVLKQAIWGFEEPLRGFHSTLSLAFIDEIEELKSLDAKEDRTPEEEKRREHLRGGEARWMVDSRLKDPQYDRFLKLGREMGEEAMFGRLDRYPTHEENEAIEGAVKRVVRRMLHGEEPEAPTPAM